MLHAVFGLVGDLGRSLVVVAPQRDVARVQRHQLVDDAGLHGRARLLGVALGDVEAVEDHLVGRRRGLFDVGALAAELAGQDEHFVTFFDLHYSTSGASEMMRMNFLSRSSRPTGPKMRVPRGCSWSLISTAAFSSNLM